MCSEIIFGSMKFISEKQNTIIITKIIYLINFYIFIINSECPKQAEKTVVLHSRLIKSDPDWLIAHYGSVVVNEGAKIGKNCRIHEGVTIGATNGSMIAATIGDNCFIGTGAKIIGEVTIGDGATIGANAVVTKSFCEQNCVLAGVPAKKIKQDDSKSNLNPMLFE